MKVHLIRSPEYELENLKEVYELLNSHKGPMEFEMNDYTFDINEFPFLQYELYPHHDFRIESEMKKERFIKDWGYPLSWEELFSLCAHFRKNFRVRKSDFVVLLTNRINSLNWFSHCNEDKNVFIHAAEWDKLYIKAKYIYPVAYQVIENVLQNLMGIDSLEINNEFAHFRPRGCINDFCKDKREVILKLRTADICETCLERMLTSKIPVELIDQIFQILEGLRIQFLFKKNINRIAGPYSIYFNEDYKLIIPQLGNKELKLEPLLSTIYIFFLMHSEGVLLKNIENHSSDLKKIYRIMNPNTTPDQVKKTIEQLTRNNNKLFIEKKSKINKEIKKLLGSSMAEDFLISGTRGKPFKINLSLENTDISF